MERANEQLRPDNCGVIFEKVEDTFFLGTLAADYKLTPLLDRQIAMFLQEGYSVVLNARPRKQVWLAQGHTQEMLKGLLAQAAARVLQGRSHDALSREAR
jgi:hypothetical protein